MDRYNEALKASAVTEDDALVASQVAEILEKVPQYESKEVYKFLLNSVDLTTLQTEDSELSVAKFTTRVNDFDNDYPQYGHVAAICVYSNFAEVVKTHLDVPGVDVCVVAAGFPSSQTFQAVKVADCALAVEAGAQEVDIVFPVGMYLDGNYEDLCDEIIELKHTVKKAKLKVILETGLLKTARRIKEASILSMYCDADFMCQCIKVYYEKTGRKVGFKAAGGVRSTADAMGYYAIVKEVLGDEWLCHDLFRLGASSLANNLLSSLEGTEVKYF